MTLKQSSIFEKHWLGMDWLRTRNMLHLLLYSSFLRTFRICVKISFILTKDLIPMTIMWSSSKKRILMSTWLLVAKVLLNSYGNKHAFLPKMNGWKNKRCITHCRKLTSLKNTKWIRILEFGEIWWKDTTLNKFQMYWMRNCF